MKGEAGEAMMDDDKAPARPGLVEERPSSSKEDKASTGSAQAEKGERRRLGVRFG